MQIKCWYESWRDLYLKANYLPKRRINIQEMEGEIRESQSQAFREVILGNFEWERSLFKTVGPSIKN